MRIDIFDIFMLSSAKCRVEIIIKIIICEPVIKRWPSVSGFPSWHRPDLVIWSEPAAKITKEVMKSHGCTFHGCSHCPCLQFVQMELSRRKVPVYVSILITSQLIPRTFIKWVSKRNLVLLMEVFFLKTGSPSASIPLLLVKQLLLAVYNRLFAQLIVDFFGRKHSCLPLQWLQRQPVICVYKLQMSNSTTHSWLCLHFRRFSFYVFPSIWFVILFLSFVLSVVKLQLNGATWLKVLVVWIKVVNGYNTSLFWF